MSENPRSRTKIEIVSHVKRMGREFRYRQWGPTWSEVRADCIRLTGGDHAKLKRFERTLYTMWVRSMPPEEQKGRL